MDEERHLQTKELDTVKYNDLFATWNQHKITAIAEPSRDSKRHRNHGSQEH